MPGQLALVLPSKVLMGVNFPFILVAVNERMLASLEKASFSPEERYGMGSGNAIGLLAFRLSADSHRKEHKEEQVMETLKGKVALVTGASKGIGAGIAKELGAAGATVVVNYSTSKEGAEAVVTEITALGGQALALQGDFSKAEDIDRVFDQVKEKYGKLDILVNNAGIYRMAPIEALTAESFHQHFNLNVLGLLLSVKASLPLFGPEGGSIINIGSIASTMAAPMMAIYAGTKGAVNSITTSLSKELGPRKIRVNSLNPGFVATEGMSGFIGSPFHQGTIKATPLGRVAEPVDIARIAVFLASDESYWLSGQHITAAGGMTA